MFFNLGLCLSQRTSMKSLPGNPSPATMKLNPHLWPSGAARPNDKAPNHVKVAPKSGKRLKQSLVTLNKLESEFYETIRYRFPIYPKVRSHAITYLLAPGLRYTPDFTCASWPDWNFEGESLLYHNGPDKPIAWEVKGGRSWDDAIVKIKMAPTIFPEINWWFVDKHNGQWRWQRML